MARATFTVSRLLPYLLIVAGIIGCVASFVLTYDKLQILQNPNYNPACNINPIFSCGSVMRTEQASLFGVPNTIFGLVGFTMLLTLGVVLAAGAKLPRWIWFTAQAAAAAGVVFVHYLFFQGVYRIDAICPWCFLTWITTIPVFLYITVYNLRQRYVVLPKVGEFIRRYHLRILIGWYLLILALLLEHFWYYWKTLI